MWTAHGHRRLDWVVVRRGSLVCDEVEVGAEVEDTLLHLEAVRVSVESLAASLESWELPIGNNFFAKAITDRDSVQANLPLKGLLHVWQQAQHEVVHLVALIVAVVANEALNVQVCRLVDLKLAELAELAFLLCLFSLGVVLEDVRTR